MWSYYGSKSKVINYYPPPKFDKIIEPFAGTARYSLKYFDRDILLVDKYDVIIKIWKWLQQCSKEDIMSLPEPKYHENVNDFNICDEAKLMLGFMANRGNATPCNLINNFSNIGRDKKRVANNLFKIKHWKFENIDYRDIKNTAATWFIDPPYQFGGEHYKISSSELSFEELSLWCQSRSGHIIVCENTKADWMPFNKMVSNHGAYSNTTEAIWSNYPTEYDMQQMKLSL